jgi:hypothetical protein
LWYISIRWSERAWVQIPLSSTFLLLVFKGTEIAFGLIGRAGRMIGVAQYGYGPGSNGRGKTFGVVRCVTFQGKDVVGSDCSTPTFDSELRNSRVVFGYWPYVKTSFLGVRLSIVSLQYDPWTTPQASMPYVTSLSSMLQSCTEMSVL